MIDETTLDEHFILLEWDRPFVSNVLYLYAQRLEELATRPELSDAEKRRLSDSCSRARKLSHQINPSVSQFNARGREAPVGVTTGLMYPRSR
jgi:hypothetical protein